uniref:Uncharacterized protein n=1 Tax=Trichuris muris TaxID=70415 RepID=A0A5S6Q9J3_TRIMR
MEEIILSLTMTSVCDECDRPYVERWIASDSEDQGQQLMNVEEIIEFFANQAADTEEEQADGNEMDELVDLKQEQGHPSNSEAFHHPEEGLRWFEAQTDCDPQRLLCLKRICDLAATKRRTVIKQTSITKSCSNA